MPLKWAEAVRLLPSDEAAHPEAVCRGCAGLGYGGEHVTPRVAQFLETPAWIFAHDAHPRAARAVRVTRHSYHSRGAIHAPYGICIAVIEGLTRTGWRPEDGCPPLPERAWTCPWCDGTGKPSLSVETMQARLR